MTFWVTSFLVQLTFNKMADDSDKKTEVNKPNEFTIPENWKQIGQECGTNALVGGGVGILLSLVLFSYVYYLQYIFCCITSIFNICTYITKIIIGRGRRATFIGFSSGIGFGIGWRDSHATSVFLNYSTPINPSHETLYNKIIRLYEQYKPEVKQQSSE